MRPPSLAFAVFIAGVLVQSGDAAKLFYWKTNASAEDVTTAENQNDSDEGGFSVDPNDQDNHEDAGASVLSPNGYARSQAMVKFLPGEPPILGAYATATSNDSVKFSPMVMTANSTVEAIDHLVVFAKPDYQLSDLFLGAARVKLRLHGTLNATSDQQLEPANSRAIATYNITIPYQDANGNNQELITSKQLQYESNTTNIFPNGREPVNGEFTRELDDTTAFGFNGFPFNVERIFTSRISGLAEWTIDLNLQASVVSGSTTSATADISDTFQVESITFYDTNGNIIPGIGVMNDDGVQYPMVPEPNSSLLAVFGALNAGAYRSGRRFSRRE